MNFTAFPRLITLLLAIWLTACNDEKGSNKPVNADKSGDTPAQKSVAAATDNKPPAKRPPTINIADSISIKRTVLYVKDSAATTERVGMKLAKIYGEQLAKCIKDNKLTMTGAPLAWYNSQQPPFFFEAGVPVDKKPGKLPAGVMIREIPAGPVMVAHYYGPYEMMEMAYTALTERMAMAKATAAGKPYEIYIGDPGTEKDPYKVLTDIVFPVQLPAEKKQ